MTPKTLTFLIGGGEVVLEAAGFKGGACEVAAKAFEETLGGKVTGKKLKSEYYEREPVVTIKAGGVR